MEDYDICGNDKFYDFSKDDDISLEPRLMEYLKKKKYFKEHGIEKENLERDFQITDKDMFKIRAHYRGDKKGESRTSDYVDPSNATFPSSEFKKDPRFDRIKKKQERDADAQFQRSNYGLINKGFDMYRNDRPFASAFGDDFNKTDFHPRQWFENSKDVAKNEKWNPRAVKSKCEDNKYTNSRKNVSINQKSSNNGYISHNSTIQNDPHSLDSIMNKMSDYKNKITPYKQHNKQDDAVYSNIPKTCHSYEIPKRTSNTNIISDNVIDYNMDDQNLYRANPVNGDDRNIDIDTYVRANAGTRNSKSIGYPNPVDHYFSFISDDIQQPEHVVNMRGIPSRSVNKQMARPTIRRDVLP